MKTGCDCDRRSREDGVGTHSQAVGFNCQTLLAGSTHQSCRDCSGCMWDANFAHQVPFAEGTTDIARFMNDTWPADNPEHRPNFLSIDKGCQVMATLNVNNELTGNYGWMRTTSLKVDPWHYN